MTKPRRHIAGQVAMLTRHCVGRQYLLRPDGYISQVLAFESAKAARRNCVALYGAMAMSNQIHYVVGDVLAKRSFFMQSAMSGTAKARNHDLQREGYFWASGSYIDTVLLDRLAIEAHLLEMWLFPVEAGLVERVEDWPGFKILPKDWGERIEVKRPGKFYGRKNPETVVLIPVRPPGYEEMTLEEVKAYFEAKIKKREAQIKRARRAIGRGVSGVKKVEAIEPTYSPEAEWPPVRKNNPRFSTTDAKLMSRVVATYDAFCQEYEAQRRIWLKGTKQKIWFPCGTLALRYKAPIKCLGPPDDEPGLLARYF